MTVSAWHLSFCNNIYFLIKQCVFPKGNNELQPHNMYITCTYVNSNQPRIKKILDELINCFALLVINYLYNDILEHINENNHLFFMKYAL